MINKYVIALIITLTVMNISVLAIWYLDKPTPIEDSEQYTKLEQKIYKLIEASIWNNYHDTKTNCNITKELLILQSKNATLAFVGNTGMTIDEWHKDCLRIVEQVKELSIIELEKEFQ